MTTFGVPADPTRENGITPYAGLLRGLSRRETLVLPLPYHGLPIRDVGTSSTAALAARLLDVIDAALANDGIVYFHCRAGIGRTGTLMDLHLVRWGCAPCEALRRVQAV